MSKISVILAACKGEKFIGAQLESLRLQTRVPDELLIGDDSGADTLTAEAVETWRRTRTVPFPVRLFRNPSPLGVNGNFRMLAEKAQGEIIFFCDQDDFWLPEKISRLAAILESLPKYEAVCAFSTVANSALIPAAVQDDSEITAARKVPAEKLFPAFLRNTVTGSGHNIAIRKSLLAKLPLWDGLFLYDAWLLRSCAAAGKLFLLPERVTLRRVHGGNLTIGCEGNTGGRLRPRLHLLLHKVPEADEFRHLLTQWELFRKNLRASPLYGEVPEKNLQLLDDCLSYMKARIAQREKSLPGRLFIPPELFRGYFRFGNRFRSVIRDLAGL